MASTQELPGVFKFKGVRSDAAFDMEFAGYRAPPRQAQKTTHVSRLQVCL
jgi:hypothetical protein